jgi:glucose-6-phosphate isomerase
VEAGKKAAGTVIEIQRQIIALLKSKPGQAFTASELAKAISRENEIETVFKVANHLAANPSHHISKAEGKNPFEAAFKLV